MVAEGCRDGGLGVGSHRVQEGYWRVLRADQEFDLGAGEDECLGSGVLEPFDDVGVGRSRAALHPTEGELIEDDPIHVGAIGFAGYVDGQPRAGEAADVEVLFHHPSGAENAEPRPTGRTGPVGDGVGDVEEWNVDGGLNVVGDTVHEVGADQHDVGSRLLAALSSLAQQRGCGGPVAADLAVPDLGEVE